jgi:hypothetical protein
MPDALICYPGSTEKLKLLGATYLLTYLLQFVRLRVQGSNDSLANFNHQPDMHFKYHPEGAHIVYSSKGNQEVLQVVVHKSNHCSTSQTSLQYP